MKKTFFRKAIINRSSSLAAICACAVLAGVTPLLAGDNKTPITQEEPNLSNWAEFGVGGMIYTGDHAQGQQRTGVTEGMFGGIDDMHLEKALPNKWFATLDGHAIFGNYDFDLKLDISKVDVGYVRVGFTEFRSYYDGLAGFFPNSQLPGDGLIFTPLTDSPYLDRGDVWLETGLRMPDLPEITLRYDHIWREGSKDATDWGDTTLIGTNFVTNNTRKIVPAFRDINERRDVFAADVKQTFGKTDVGIGARAELTHNDDSLNIGFNPGQFNTTPAYSDVTLSRFVTQHDTLQSDMFSTHATTETRFCDKVWLTTAYSYSTVNSDLGGSRIYGATPNSAFAGLFGVSNTTNPLNPLLPLAASSTSAGYVDLFGGSETVQNEFNVNLLYMPIPTVSILSGFRFDKEDTDSVANYIATAVNTSAKAYFVVKGKTTSVTYLQPTTDPFADNSSYTLQKLAENFEVRYTGLEDWVLYARGDWDEDEQNRSQSSKNAILIQQYQKDPVTPSKLVPTIKVAGSLSSGTVTIDDNFDDTRMVQKYSVGANWYPCRMVNFAAQYYHKEDDNDYGSDYIQAQDFATDDVNFRITAKPLNNLSLVSRYDYLSTKSVTSAEMLLPQDSATSTSHMFTECITWNPLDRLYLQGNFSYVFNVTDTDAAITIQDPTYFTVAPKTGAINTTYKPGNPLIGPVNFSFKNNYWTAGLGAGFALDDKTDLHMDYTYYRAADYGNNSLFAQPVLISQPYGAGQEEQTVSASIQRQLCRNARLTLKYAFTSYRDETFYGYANFNAHQISTSVMVRF